MKGIILAGGNGTRLRPATFITNKHLLPVLNVPMILYPINTLKKLGVHKILLITGGNHIGAFAEFLGDGSSFDVEITYKVQKEAGGIAQALSLAGDFVPNNEIFPVILGDNFFDKVPNALEGIFSKREMKNEIQPSIFLKKVSDPERFGVFYKDENKIIEKPIDKKSNLAVTGLYFYDSAVFNFISGLKPSKRGELEITDVNNWYLKCGLTKVFLINGFWSDMGTPKSLLKTILYLNKKAIDF